MRRPKGLHIKTDQLIAAIYACGGVTSHVARMLGVTITAVYYRINSDQRVKDAFEDARKVIIDEAEGAMLKLCRKGDFNAARFVLQHLGKGRGYTMQDAEFAEGDMRPVVNIVVNGQAVQ